jgi:hypothetical protein
MAAGATLGTLPRLFGERFSWTTLNEVLRGFRLGSALALSTLLGACGGGDGSVSLATRYARVESCVGFEAAMPLLRLEPAVECPMSRKPCCLESVGYFPCAAGQCGANGRYEPDTKTIVLPEGCDIGFEHESVHHLLDAETGDPDMQHKSPLFALCGNS